MTSRHKMMTGAHNHIMIIIAKWIFTLSIVDQPLRCYTFPLQEMIPTYSPIRSDQVLCAHPRTRTDTCSAPADGLHGTKEPEIRL